MDHGNVDLFGRAILRISSSGPMAMAINMDNNISTNTLSLSISISMLSNSMLSNSTNISADTLRVRVRSRGSRVWVDRMRCGQSSTAEWGCTRTG